MEPTGVQKREPLCALVGIDHDLERIAYVEIADEPTWQTGRDPQPPPRV